MSAAWFKAYSFEPKPKKKQSDKASLVGYETDLMEELKLFSKARKKQSTSSSNSADMVLQVPELLMLRYSGKSTGESSKASEYVTVHRCTKQMLLT